VFWKKVFSLLVLIVSVYLQKNLQQPISEKYNSEPAFEDVSFGETVAVARSKLPRHIFEENLLHILPYNGFPGAFCRYLDC
jgi:hypothetical protein